MEITKNRNPKKLKNKKSLKKRRMESWKLGKIGEWGWG
jgi:hypothetical protein